MMHQRETASRTHKAKMERLFQAGDADGDGCLCREEFLELTQNAEVKIWLLSMGLDAADGDALFDLIDANGDGRLSVCELVEGVSKLKGGARSLDLLSCLRRQDKLYQRLLGIQPGMAPASASACKDVACIAIAADKDGADDISGDPKQVPVPDASCRGTGPESIRAPSLCQMSTEE
ncbi:unnamed protein product [Prorocentrum cordatum]|uniref:EF-hand domain-containing protein n=1 Tax=Prorocentrum cordatum TaxID=2364126 RepID=A0ABN9QDH5_9DINO|nr:unnamed protein product [Polarella glacialis]